MMKRIFVLLMAIAMIASLSMIASAEYVACLTPTEEHAMSDWKEVEKKDDGSALFERTCSKCKYVQKGFAGAGSSGDQVATTRDNMAVTTSLDITTEAIPAPNPSTGARA